MSGLGNDTIIDMEQAQITGGAGANTLDASAFTGPATLDGAGGPDSLLGGTSDDHLIGDTGDDTMQGGSGSDTLNGNDGDDNLDGDGEDDLLLGGPGEDDLDGGTGSDLLDGDAGVDKVANGLAAEVDEKLVATLTSVGGASGTAEFEVSADDDTEIELEIEVENAAPGSYDIVVGGSVLGSKISVSVGGSGSIEFSNDPDDLGEFALPAVLAALTTGTTISIPGVVDGIFAPEGEVANGPNGTDSILGAPLASFGSAIGIAEFESEFENGIEERELDVEIEDATPSTTFDVSINGVVVGQITTDASGDGILAFSTNPDDPDEQVFPGGFANPEAFQTIDIGTLLTGVFVGI